MPTLKKLNFLIFSSYLWGLSLFWSQLVKSSNLKKILWKLLKDLPTFSFATLWISKLQVVKHISDDVTYFLPIYVMLSFFEEKKS